MARCSFATWIGPTGTPGGPIEPRVAILHVDDVAKGLIIPASTAKLEWHFWVAFDGHVYQLNDTGVRCDANYKANAFAISIESEGRGDGAWTPEQLDAIVRLLRWLNEVHHIPLTRCGSWDGSGIGHHTMWGAPSPWTPVAKSCPGPKRKLQFDRYIIPTLNKPPAPPTPPEVDMTSPAICFLDSTRHLFCHGRDGALWHKEGQGAWKKVGGELADGSSPSAAVVEGVIQVAVTGTTGEVFLFKLIAGKWSGPSGMGGGVA